MKDRILYEKAHYYNIIHGEFKHYEGRIAEKRCYGTKIKYHFLIRMRSERERHLICHENQFVVLNSGLWMENRDDEKAKAILVRYKQEVIRELESKINRCLKDISILTSNPH